MMYFDKKNVKKRNYFLQLGGEHKFDVWLSELLCPMLIGLFKFIT